MRPANKIRFQFMPFPVSCGALEKSFNFCEIKRTGLGDL